VRGLPFVTSPVARIAHPGRAGPDGVVAAAVDRALFVGSSPIGVTVPMHGLSIRGDDG